MISREDFIFTIGYDGDKAVVDSNAKKNYSKLSTFELLEKGFFRAAFSSALYSNDEREMSEFIAKYNEIAKTDYRNVDEMCKYFGVYREKIEKTLLV